MQLGTAGGMAANALETARYANPRITNSHRRKCIRRSLVIRGSALDGFMGMSSLLKPEIAAMFSAVLAIGSVGLNYYGALLTERKRVELQKELDRERLYREQTSELQSLIARYRGPLLESSVDLEQRLWHLATMTGEWYSAPKQLAGEEVTYTMFTLAQLLGFLEVVRRESPRERAFLQVGNPQGADTLATLVEGMRFCMCASAATLEAWGGDGDERDHPGARERRPYVPRKGKRRAMVESELQHAPLRVSRGMQRAIGSEMIATTMGAERHYTLSYAEFVRRLHTDTEFAQWFQPIEADLAALLTGPSWMGASPFPLHVWSRVLLLQQLLVDAMDLLDPDYVRVPATRRLRLAPVAYRPLPNVEAYKRQLSLLSAAIDFNHQPHEFAALANLSNPKQALEAAGSWALQQLPPNGSGASVDAPGFGAPILGGKQLPAVGASGVALLPGALDGAQAGGGEVADAEVVAAIVAGQVGAQPRSGGGSQRHQV